MDPQIGKQYHSMAAKQSKSGNVEHEFNISFTVKDDENLRAVSLQEIFNIPTGTKPTTAAKRVSDYTDRITLAGPYGTSEFEGAALKYAVLAAADMMAGHGVTLPDLTKIMSDAIVADVNTNYAGQYYLPLYLGPGKYTLTVRTKNIAAIAAADSWTTPGNATVTVDAVIITEPRVKQTMEEYVNCVARVKPSNTSFILPDERTSAKKFYLFGTSTAKKSAAIADLKIGDRTVNTSQLAHLETVWQYENGGTPKDIDDSTLLVMLPITSREAAQVSLMLSTAAVLAFVAFTSVKVPVMSQSEARAVSANKKAVQKKR